MNSKRLQEGLSAARRAYDEGNGREALAVCIEAVVKHEERNAELEVHVSELEGALRELRVMFYDNLIDNLTEEESAVMDRADAALAKEGE